MPPRGTPGLLLALLAFLALACATPGDVTFDEGTDFSRYRTWDWLPESPRSVDAPSYDVTALDQRLAEAVEAHLEARGLVRTGVRPDFRVGAWLLVRSRIVVVRTTGATQTLFSFTSASPTYEVQSTREELHSYEEGRLLVFVRDERSGRLVWRGALDRRVDDDFAPHLEDVVSSLLAKLPSS